MNNEQKDYDGDKKFDEMMKREFENELNGKVMKTALEELIEWFRETHPLITTGGMVKKMHELLEKEKEQMESAAIWGCNYSLDNICNKNADSEKAFKDYLKQTYNQQ